MLKSYTITVNGTVYDVTVEEKTGAAATAAAPVSRPAPAVSAAPAKISAPAAPAAGSIPVKAGAAGKVFKIVSAVGDTVKKGDPVIIIEAMKMEIPLVAPQDGVVASISCAVGDACNAGDVMALLQ